MPLAAPVTIATFPSNFIPPLPRLALLLRARFGYPCM